MKTYPLLLVVSLVCPSFVVAQSVPQQPLSAHAWRQSQQTNTADAYTYARFTLNGTFLSGSHDGHDGVVNRPALVVNCIPGDESPRGRATFLTGNLIVGSTLKIVYVEPEEIRGISFFPKVAVRYRTDDKKKAVDEQWSPRSDSISASIPKHSLKEILRARSVTITAQDDLGKQVAMRFDMPDPTPVEQGCNVDEH
jgi:hypothetical protein